MKKQVRKLTKKILILTLATSLVVTSCFSYKKIEAHAAAATASLGAWTLYEICLYFGGLAISALGIGAIYENRDEIAEFGKSVIDSMTAIPEEGWFFGSTSAQEDPTIYGREALVAVQMAQWAAIVMGGQSPKNDDDNDGDGDKDEDDRTKELGSTAFFLTAAGTQLMKNVVQTIHDKWVNKEEDNILDPKYGIFNGPYFDGFDIDSDGNYYGFLNYEYDGVYKERTFRCNNPLVIFYDDRDFLNNYFHVSSYDGSNFAEGSSIFWEIPKSNTSFKVISTNLPIVYPVVGDSYSRFVYYKEIPEISNHAKSYQVADWIAEDEEWKGYLEDIATSLRSLQDLTNIAQQLADGALTTQPTADAYGDMMVNISVEYTPSTEPVTDPVYWPATNPTPTLDPSVLPNYQPSTNPDPGTDPDSPGDDSGGSEEPPETIDTNGLLSLFNILLYLIMIIIMLIYLFLACLAFIVMIFRIPASSSMLPEEMVMGFEHLKTIMIPGMNISIYGFAMALIYMFIVFAVIRALRLEINHFRIPRSYK